MENDQNAGCIGAFIVQKNRREYYYTVEFGVKRCALSAADDSCTSTVPNCAWFTDS